MMVILWTIYSLLSSLSIQVQQYQHSFHVIWIIALIGATIPVAANYQQNTGGWCYIKETADGLLMQFFCDYLWCLITWGFSLILLCGVRSRESLQESAIIAQVRYYPLVFFVCWLFGVIRRAVRAFGVHPPLYLVALQILFTNLYGFSNAVVWGLTVYNHIRKMRSTQNLGRKFPTAHIRDPEATERSTNELPDNKLIHEEEHQYNAKDGRLVEIDLSADGDDGLVEVQEASD